MAGTPQGVHARLPPSTKANAVKEFNPQAGLKAHHVIAWAGASQRAKAQVTRTNYFISSEKATRFLKGGCFAPTGLGYFLSALPGPSLVELAPAQAITLQAFSLFRTNSLTALPLALIPFLPFAFELFVYDGLRAD